MLDRPDPAPITEQFDLSALITDLVTDLKQLRSGQITIRDARARADLAKQILRGVHYVVQARKFLEGGARSLPGNEGQS